MVTKFRAFQLDSPGSLFSYWKNDVYTLIEARLPKGGISVLGNDIKYHSKDRIDVLHITSWDKDHCEFNALSQILNQYRPNVIEVPSYIPDNEEAILCRNLIYKYDAIHQKYDYNVVKYDKANIDRLDHATEWSDRNVVYHSHYNVTNHNDMSQIRLFRSTGISVFSPGDCESIDITKQVLADRILCAELDVLILPHHGSDNSMLTGQFLDICKPSLAICSSNYDNVHEHPRPAVSQMLTSRNIKTMTTKRGDVIVWQKESNLNPRAVNLVSNNQDAEQPFIFKSKRQSVGL